MSVLCLQPTKSRLQLGFDCLLPVSPATCTTGHGKEVSTENGFQHSLQRTILLRAETIRLERQGRGSVLGREVAVLYRHFDPWTWRLTSAGNPQEVK